MDVLRSKSDYCSDRSMWSECTITASYSIAGVHVFGWASVFRVIDILVDWLVSTYNAS